MAGFLSDIELIIRTNPFLAFPAVFVGGLMTAANPCVLAMVPLSIAYVGGHRQGSGLGRSFLLSLFLIFGLAVTFTAMGLVAVMTGRLLGDVGDFWPWVIAGVCLFMGLHLLGLFSFRVPSVISGIRPSQRGVIGAFLIGILFGVVSTPCAAPVLAVVLAFVASRADLIYGTSLLGAYAVGHGMLILAAGTSMGIAKGILESKGLHRTMGWLRKGSGVVIILVGFWVLFMGRT